MDIKKLTKCVKELRNDIDVEHNEWVIAEMFQPIINNKLTVKFKKTLSFEDYQEEFDNLLLKILKICKSDKVGIYGLLPYIKSLQWGKVTGAVKSNWFNDNCIKLDGLKNIDNDGYNGIGSATNITEEIIGSINDDEMFKAQVLCRFKGLHRDVIELMMDGVNDFNIMKKVKINSRKLYKLKGSLAPMITKVLSEIKGK